MDRSTLSLAIIILAIGLESQSPAGAIAPWNGASASLQIFDQTRESRGASASGSIEASTNIPYRNWNGRFTTHVRASVSAVATPDASRVLQIEARYHAGTHGTNPLFEGGPNPVNSSVGWTGDRVILTPTGDANMPDQVRLTLGITLTRWYDGGTFGSVLFRYGDESLRLSNDNRWPGPLWYSFGNGASGVLNAMSYHPQGLRDVAAPGFDRMTSTQNGYPFGENVFHGTVHLDLPVDRQGISDPFDLLLESKANGGMAEYSSQSLSLFQNPTISIDDITLPDGTSLSSHGLTASFASGMAWGRPAPVPEPSSLAAWSIGAALAGLARWRQQRGWSPRS